MEGLPGHPHRPARARERRLIELPSWRGPADDPARVIALVDAWAASPAIAELVAAFGGEVPAARPLDWLDAFSAEHWDFRGGRERNLARPAELTAAQASAVQSVAEELGLSGRETLPRAEYDAVLMTGGMVRAEVVKPRHVAALLEAGLRAREVVFLGAARPFGGDELALAQSLGIAAHDEVSAMIAGMERAFGPLGEPVVSTGDGWSVHRWGRFQVVAAPSSESSRRANTADTFRFWAAQRTPGTASALVVTTPIYVPYQGAVAVEVLGIECGLVVDTVGTSAAAADLGEYTQPFLPAHQLQELRSAIRGMRSLRLALERAGGA